ncbi:hypothetical protein I8F73_03480 [Enterococcus faecalis]|nr:hypothetical protein [Enterococcus faecalis]
MITIPQQTVTLSMDPTKENTYSIQLPADSQEQVSVMLDGPKLQEIEQLVNDELHPLSLSNYDHRPFRSSIYIRST